MNYAAKENKQFCNVTPNIINIKERISDQIYNNNETDTWAVLDAVLEELALRKKFNNYLTSGFATETAIPRLWTNTCETISADQIMIDTTMQRSVNAVHVQKILDNFELYMAQPISVYIDDDDKCICWDGQHTAISLILIYKHVLGIADLSKIQLPITKHCTHLAGDEQRAAIRQMFIQLNGSAKLPLTYTNKYAQSVHAYRADNSRNDEDVMANTKQEILEKHESALTEAKATDADEDGMINRTSEFDGMEPEVLDALCLYHNLTARGQTYHKEEIWVLEKYLEKCRQAGQTLDAKFLARFKMAAKVAFGNDWSPQGQYEINLKKTYKKWADRQKDYEFASNTKTNAKSFDYFYHGLEKAGFKHPISKQEWGGEISYKPEDIA